MKKTLPLILAPFTGIAVGILLAFLYIIKISWEVVWLLVIVIKAKSTSKFKFPHRFSIPKNQVSFIFFLFFSVSLLAQPPQAFKWQGVVRNDQLEVISSQAVNIKFSILEGSENGGAIYIEKHQVITNELGLLSLNLGKGTFLDGSFTAIPWGTKRHFLKVELDITGGEDFQMMGISELFVTSGGGSIKDTNNWIKKEDNLYYTGGNIGIGINTPTSRLEVDGEISSNSKWPAYHWRSKSNSASYTMDVHPSNGALSIYDATNKQVRFQLLSNGNIGIGKFPNANLDVHGTILSNQLTSNNISITNSWPHLKFETFSGKTMYFEMPPTGNLYLYDPANSKYRLYFDPNGNAGIGTTKPTAAWHVAGTTKTNILEIVGGADITERISSKEKIAPGEVVTIDVTTPNHVKRSTKAYDKAVIGIVSGAGGIKSGMELKQEGLLDGNTAFALAGRVYVKVTGKVKPGDLLTTSNVPGHAMVATKRKKAHGTIIGKALSQNNNGLALVLVNLQ